MALESAGFELQTTALASPESSGPEPSPPKARAPPPPPSLLRPYATDACGRKRPRGGRRSAPGGGGGEGAARVGLPVSSCLRGFQGSPPALSDLFVTRNPQHARSQQQRCGLGELTWQLHLGPPFLVASGDALRILSRLCCLSQTRAAVPCSCVAPQEAKDNQGRVPGKRRGRAARGCAQRWQESCSVFVLFLLGASHFCSKIGRVRFAETAGLGCGWDCLWLSSLVSSKDCQRCQPKSLATELAVGQGFQMPLWHLFLVVVPFCFGLCWRGRMAKLGVCLSRNFELIISGPRRTPQKERRGGGLCSGAEEQQLPPSFRRV